MVASNINFILNDDLVSVRDLDTNTTVLNYLRNVKKLTGTKEGCASGDCGACTAVVGEITNNKIKYKSINTCITFLYTLNAKHLITVENLEKQNLHAVQNSMIDKDGSQCGFCTPGIIMSMYGMYINDVKPTNHNIDKYLSGNLCRCTGYIPIKNSIKNMYKYKKNKKEDKANLKQLKKIKKNDILIENNNSKFFIHYKIKNLLKDLNKTPGSYLLTGGTDLALEVTKKRKNLKNIFYLGSNDELNYINIKNNNIHIGAATPINDIIPILEKYYPTFSKMFERYGSEQIRNTASLGGNIGSASPIGDSLPVLMSLDGKLITEGRVKKLISFDNFFIDYRKTKLGKKEIVKEIIIPLHKKHILKCYKISKRIDDDISSIFMAINAKLEHNKFKHIKIVCGGMASVPKIAKLTQSYLINKELTNANINEAKKLITKDFDPIDDVRASKEYRKKISQNLLERFYSEQNNIKSTVY